jgi:hypothetical protein
VEDAVALLGRFCLGAERHGGDDRVGGVLLKFGIAPQFVDRARRGQSLSAAATARTRAT